MTDFMSRGHASHASSDANQIVVDAWAANVDNDNTLKYAWLGPVVKVHRIDGLADIVEYVRDESNLGNPTGEGDHGQHFFGLRSPNSSYTTLQEAILAAIARSNGVQLYAVNHAVEFARRILT